MEVLQSDISYYIWEELQGHIEYIEKKSETQYEAIKAAKEHHKFTSGVFYRTQKSIYHKDLYGDHNPITKKLSRDIRLERIRKIFQSL